MVAPTCYPQEVCAQLFWELRLPFLQPLTVIRSASFSFSFRGKKSSFPRSQDGDWYFPLRQMTVDLSYPSALYSLNLMSSPARALKKKSGVPAWHLFSLSFVSLAQHMDKNNLSHHPVEGWMGERMDEYAANLNLYCDCLFFKLNDAVCGVVFQQISGLN